MTSSEVPPGPLTRVLAAVIRDGERYLICKRPAHKRHGGLWEFPGGKSEPGESDTQTAQRELREELDVDVLDAGDELFAARDPGSPFLIAFVPVTIAGTPSCTEHDELAWASRAELTTFALAPSDRAFVNSLTSARTSVSQLDGEGRE